MTVIEPKRRHREAYAGGMKTGDCGHTAGCGCEAAGCCLDCPLPACKYEMYEQGAPIPKNQARDPEIVRLREEGMGPDEIAERFGISKRTVVRVVSEARAR
jgi:hypothetical protein